MSLISTFEFFDLDIPLSSPFGIAGGAQKSAENLLVRLELSDGTVGWGECAPFPAANGDTTKAARKSLAKVDWVGRDALAWRARSAEIAGIGSASARAGAEMALLDALCRHESMALWQWFGGQGTRLLTDVTLTTDQGADVARARDIEGFSVLKVKVGAGDLEADIVRLETILDAVPCRLLLDGNCGIDKLDDALRLAETVGDRLLLFEQPFKKGQLAKMAKLAARIEAPVAADESAVTVDDVDKLAERGAASVINLKFTKSGVVETMAMARRAREHGMDLMIGAMVESPLALTAATCFAAGFGDFRFVDLDTHLWMPEVPMTGGFTTRGPVLDVANIELGHGVTPALAPPAVP